MGTKFANFSIKGSDIPETIELLKLLPSTAMSKLDLFNRIKPGLGNKFAEFIKTRAELPDNDPNKANSADTKKALDFLYSTNKTYYLSQNNGWTTIVNEEFGFESIDHIAQSISRNSPRLVMAIANFDDDVFVFALYKKGKLITRNVSGGEAYEMPDIAGDTAAMSEALEIPDKKDDLKSILDNEDIWDKFDDLEKLLGMQLWFLGDEIEEGDIDGLQWHEVTI